MFDAGPAAMSTTSKMWAAFRLQALHQELAELQKATNPDDPTCSMVWNVREREALVTVMDAILDTSAFARAKQEGLEDWSSHEQEQRQSERSLHSLGVVDQEGCLSRGVYLVYASTRLAPSYERHVTWQSWNLAHGRLPSSGSFRRNHPIGIVALDVSVVGAPSHPKPPRCGRAGRAVARCPAGAS
jgi:hypothetical protein